MSKTNKKHSVLCTQTCPYRLAKLGTSLRVRGKLTLRKKAIKFYKTVVNTCLSFLNEVKNLAKNTGVKYPFAIIRCRILR